MIDIFFNIVHFNLLNENNCEIVFFRRSPDSLHNIHDAQFYLITLHYIL